MFDRLMMARMTCPSSLPRPAVTMSLQITRFVNESHTDVGDRGAKHGPSPQSPDCGRGDGRGGAGGGGGVAVSEGEEAGKCYMKGYRRGCWLMLVFLCCLKCIKGRRVAEYLSVVCGSRRASIYIKARPSRHL